MSAIKGKESSEAAEARLRRKLLGKIKSGRSQQQSLSNGDSDAEESPAFNARTSTVDSGRSIVKTFQNASADDGGRKRRVVITTRTGGAASSSSPLDDDRDDVVTMDDDPLSIRPPQPMIDRERHRKERKQRKKERRLRDEEDEFDSSGRRSDDYGSYDRGKGVRGGSDREEGGRSDGRSSFRDQRGHYSASNIAPSGNSGGDRAANDGWVRWAKSVGKPSSSDRTNNNSSSGSGRKYDDRDRDSELRYSDRGSRGGGGSTRSRDDDSRRGVGSSKILNSQRSRFGHSASLSKIDRRQEDSDQMPAPKKRKVPEAFRKDPQGDSEGAEEGELSPNSEGNSRVAPPPKSKQRGPFYSDVILKSPAASDEEGELPFEQVESPRNLEKGTPVMDEIAGEQGDDEIAAIDEGRPEVNIETKQQKYKYSKFDESDDDDDENEVRKAEEMGVQSLTSAGSATELLIKATSLSRIHSSSSLKGISAAAKAGSPFIDKQAPSSDEDNSDQGPEMDIDDRELEDMSSVKGSDEEAVADAADNGEESSRSPSPDLPIYFPGISGCRSVEEFHHMNRIEEGTYGVVYRAKEKRTDDVVALKRLKMEKEKDGFPITSLREINMLLKAKHENVVNVREIVVGSNMDKIYMVMDFVEHDLKSLMERMKQPFLIGEAKTLLKQLLAGVRHLHDNWILHRDLKTSNLLLSHHGILKIGDFGLAREYGSPLKVYTQVVVTLWYRAPELLLGSKVNKDDKDVEYSTPIDMWSVGCIFAEFILMKPLFAGKGELNQLERIFKTLGTPNNDIWPGYSELPMVKRLVFPNYPYNSLRKTIGATLSDCGFQLLNRFLTYNPARRFTAAEGLAHDWFREAPLPVHPSMFPTWPAKSEQGKAPPASGAEPKAPEGGKQFAEMNRDDSPDAPDLYKQLNIKPKEAPAATGFSIKFDAPSLYK